MLVWRSAVSKRGIKLDPMVQGFALFEESPVLSTVARLTYIPTSSMQVSSILTSICCYLVF